jgi:hypothetical protein
MRLFSFIQTTSVLLFYAARAVAEAVIIPSAINIPFSQVWYVFLDGILELIPNATADLV